MAPPDPFAIAARPPGQEAAEESAPSSVTAVVNDPRLDPDQPPRTSYLAEAAPQTASFRVGEQLPSESIPWSDPSSVDAHDEHDDDDEEEPRTQPRPSVGPRREREGTMEIDGVDSEPTPKAAAPWMPPHAEVPVFRPRQRASTIRLPEHPEAAFKPPRRRAHMVAVRPQVPLDGPMPRNARLGTMVIPARRDRGGTMEIPAAAPTPPGPRAFVGDRREPSETAEEAIDEPTPFEDQESELPDSERPPAAVRPLGRLGGDEGGWALSLDFRREEKRAAAAAAEGAATLAREPGPARFPGTVRIASEAEKLEAWLASLEGETPGPATADPTSFGLLGGWNAPGPHTDAMVGAAEGPQVRLMGEPLADGLPRTVSFGPPTAPFAAFDLSASLAPLRPLDAPTRTGLAPPPPPPPAPEPQAGQEAEPAPPTPGVAPPPQEAALPFVAAQPPAALISEQTEPAVAAASPHEPPDDSEAARLERWLAAAIDDTVGVAVPALAPLPLGIEASVGPDPLARGFAIAPNPIVEAEAAAQVGAPPHDEAAAAPEPPPLLPIELYARVKVAMWDESLPLLDALDRHGVEEAVWRDNELRMSDALAAEAQEGRVGLALELRQAIRALRSGGAEDAPELELERYALVKAALEATGRVGAAPELVLSRLGLSAEVWERARRAWARRARRDSELARRIRRAVAEARRRSAAEHGTQPGDAGGRRAETA